MAASERNENKNGEGYASSEEVSAKPRATLERCAAQRPEPDQPSGVPLVEVHPRHDHEEGDEGNLGGAHPGAGGGEDLPQGACGTLQGASPGEGANRYYRTSPLANAFSVSALTVDVGAPLPEHGA